jgi:hypothetical protein
MFIKSQFPENKKETADLISKVEVRIVQLLEAIGKVCAQQMAANTQAAR